MHALSAQYVAEAGLSAEGGFRESSFHLAIMMIEVLEGIVRSNAARLPDAQMRMLLRGCAEAKTLVADLEAAVITEYRQELLQVHGDYNPFNLMYHANGSVAYMFDLENTALDHPVHDLAEGLLDFCFHVYRPFSTRFGRLPATLNHEAALLFLDGYRSTNPSAFDRVARILPTVVGSTFIELFTLGVVRGDYDFDLMPSLAPVTHRLIAELEQVLARLQS
jgi:hypothetical protein